MKITGLENYGISAAPLAAAGGPSLSLDPSVAGQLKPLVPYSIVVHNVYTRDLIGIVIRYVWTPVSGRPRTRDLFYHTLGADDSARLLATGAVLVITPTHSINLRIVRAKNSLPLTAAESADVQNDSSDLASASGVTASLDSVIFADAKISGPDLCGTLVRLTQSTNSGSAIRSEVLARLVRGDTDEAIIQALNARADAQITKDSQTNRPDFHAMSQKRIATEFRAMMLAGSRATLQKQLETASTKSVRIFTKE